MEADFNFHNRLIFDKRMLDLARKHGIVPPEIYSEKGRTAEDAVLHQVLAYDIARQTRALLIVASVDAAQYYDRIAHLIVDLTLQASGVPEYSIRCILKPIAERWTSLSRQRIESQTPMSEEKRTPSKEAAKATEEPRQPGNRLAQLC